MSTKLTKDTFEAETKEGTSLIKFEAEWCGPCKKMTEIITEVEKDVTGVKFFTVDVDVEEELTKEYDDTDLGLLFNSFNIPDNFVSYTWFSTIDRYKRTYTHEHKHKRKI